MNVYYVSSYKQLTNIFPFNGTTATSGPTVSTLQMTILKSEALSNLQDHPTIRGKSGLDCDPPQSKVLFLISFFYLLTDRTITEQNPKVGLLQLLLLSILPVNTRPCQHPYLLDMKYCKNKLTNYFNYSPIL